MFLKYSEIYGDHLAFENSRKESLLNLTTLSSAKASMLIQFYGGVFNRRLGY